MGKWAKRAATAMVVTAVTAAASEGAIDYRQHTMAAVGGHMQALVDIVQQKVPHSDHLQTHANALADLAAIAPTLFPEGSAGGDALPAIWENADDFQAKLADFKEAADGMKTAAATGEQGTIGMALRSLGQSCKGCHDSYQAQ